MGHPQKQEAWTIWSLGDALLQTLDRERVTFHAADLRSKEVSEMGEDCGIFVRGGRRW